MNCAECGKSFRPEDRNDRICPKCRIKFDKRSEFRELINKLESTLKLDRIEGSYMTGFSYAEMEEFSLVFMKLQRKYHFPIELRDFVNERAKKEATEIFRLF